MNTVGSSLPKQPLSGRFIVSTAYFLLEHGMQMQEGIRMYVESFYEYITCTIGNILKFLQHCYETRLLKSYLLVKQKKFKNEYYKL